MEELLLKESYSNEELAELDFELSNDINKTLNHPKKLLEKIVKLCNAQLGYSLLELELSYHFYELAANAKIFGIEKNELKETKENYRLCKNLRFSDESSYYAIALGDYYFKQHNSKQALTYYKQAFKGGFNLTLVDYSNSLENFISLMDEKPAEMLFDLLSSYEVNKKDYDLELINTYLLLIAYLKEDDERYLPYLNKGIKVARLVAREIQKNSTPGIFSDTDEERGLCELVARKYKYYVNKKSFVKAHKVYQELTKEIQMSDCTRYYHARDLFYLQMLTDMQEKHKELSFIINKSSFYEVIEDVSTYKELQGQEITLRNDKNETFKFKLIYAHNEENLTVAPILPLVGEGGYLYLCVNEEDKKRLTHLL